MTIFYRPGGAWPLCPPPRIRYCLMSIKVQWTTPQTHISTGCKKGLNKMLHLHLDALLLERLLDVRSICGVYATVEPGHTVICGVLSYGQICSERKLSIIGGAPFASVLKIVSIQYNLNMSKLCKETKYELLSNFWTLLGWDFLAVSNTRILKCRSWHQNNICTF